MQQKCCKNRHYCPREKIILQQKSDKNATESPLGWAVLLVLGVASEAYFGLSEDAYMVAEQRMPSAGIENKQVSNLKTRTPCSVTSSVAMPSRPQGVNGF